jgi:predicted nucleic acid-binding protein
VGLIYLDSCLVIYLVERQGKAVAAAVSEAGERRFGVSPLVKCECLVGPIKRGDPILRQAYSDMFGTLLTLDMLEPIYLQAAELRAQFGLRTPDALHLACARHHGYDVLWTNDDRLALASRGLARRIFPNRPAAAPV